MKWKNKKAPNALLSHIKKIGFLNSDGTVSFRSDNFQFLDLEYILDSLDFSVDVDIENKISCLKTTIKDCFKNSNFSSDFFLLNYEKNLRKFSDRKITKKFALVTLSIIKPKFRKITIENSTIKFYKDFPKKFNSRRERLGLLGIKDNPNYCKCIIETETYSDEIEPHFRSINILRAFFCLIYNNDFEIIFGKSDKLLNKVVLGQYQTLHNEDGEILVNYQYENNIVPPIEIKEPVKFLQQLYQKICKSQYKEKLINSLLIFVKALDNLNPNVAFILLWNAIDQLTNTNSVNYNPIIERFKGLYENPKHAEIIERLKQIRNDYVHRIEEHRNAREYCFELQRYFFNLLFFHIHYVSHLKFEDALKVMDHLIEYSNAIEFLSKFQMNNSGPLLQIAKNYIKDRSLSNEQKLFEQTIK